MGKCADTHNHVSNCVRLHHYIDQAFTTFLVYTEKRGKALVRDYVRVAQLHIYLVELCNVLFLPLLKKLGNHVIPLHFSSCGEIQCIIIYFFFLETQKHPGRLYNKFSRFCSCLGGWGREHNII